MAISFQNVWNQAIYDTVNLYSQKVLLSETQKDQLMKYATESQKMYLEANTLPYEVGTAHDYGVVGDGNTDDTAAIQAAINAGVPIPPGNYLITSEKEDEPALWDQI